MPREILSLETKREQKFVKHAEDEGFEALKIMKRSYPDRLMILDYGYSFMIEFKRDVTKFTKRKGEKFQQYTHGQLREKLNIHVYLCDTVEQAKAILSYERQHNELSGRAFPEYQL